MSETVLPDFFLAAARRHPQAVALEIPAAAGGVRVTLSYAELEQLAAALARFLRGQVGPETVVGLALARSRPELYCALLGVLQAGAAYTALDPSFPPERARAILEDAGAPIVLTDAEGCARLEALRYGGRALDVVSWLRARSPRPAALERPAGLGPESLAYVIYTSGTTGTPKGVQIEHRGICNLVATDLERFGLGPGDRVVQSSSLAYDSSVEEIWLALACGATLLVADEETVRLGPDLREWLARERASVLCPTPTLLRTLGCADPGSELPDLRLVYVGGEALPEDVARTWSAGLWLENGYGPTECTVTVLRGRVRPGQPISIGRPVPGNGALVLDDDLRPVARGEPGELCIQGVGLARGYRNLPALTAERFREHPGLGRLYRTGDLVREDAAGAFFYLGRKDGQVKLRGYRIELGEIEACLAACAGVHEAACCLQEDSGGGFLAAFVVPEAGARAPGEEALAKDLRARLPAYMVPARFAVLDELPLSVGGKLDRAALPPVESRRAPEGAPGRAPRGPLEERIARAFAAALELAQIDPEGDFFLDLGGDSLAAAVVISELRAHESTAALTVRDLYEERSAAGLARRLERPARAETGAEPAQGPPLLNRRARPFAATCAQALWLALLLAGGAHLAYFVSFAVLPVVLLALGLVPFLLLLPVLLAGAGLLLLPLGVLLAVALKRLLVGTYRPMRVPVWSAFYLRHWMVLQALRLVPWGLLQGTVFFTWVLRALGARIGPRVHIHRGVNLLQGGWDLLELDEGATLCQGASVRVVDLQDGHLVIDAVRVGAHSTLDVRAGMDPGSAMGREAFLGAHSWLPPGAQVPDGKRFDGIPARASGAAPAAPALDAAGQVPWSEVGHGVALILARMGVAAAGSLPFLAALLLLVASLDLDALAVLRWLFHGGFEARVVAPLILLAIAGLALNLVLRALVVRLLGRIPAGVIGRWSAAYLRVWLKTEQLDAASDWLSGSLLWPLWLRLSGMRIGRGCEISTVIDTLPEQVEIGAQTFFADGIYAGGPRVHRGVVQVAATTIGPSTFVGNHALVPSGARLPGDILIGVCTVADPQRIRAGTSWFGHPPFELPRREVVTMDRRLTHEPGPWRYLRRLAWECARFALPAGSLLALLAWFQGFTWLGERWPAELFAALGVPGFALGLAAAFPLLVLVLKWTLLGRVRPGQHGLWSSWCCRWDFLYVVWNRTARAFLGALEGTLLLPFYLRAMGAHIGRRVVLGGAFAQVVDPDMLRFGDGATINCFFQAHSFEDRVLKIGPVTIGPGATVSSAAVLFYGTQIGERSWVAPHSVVMKRERLTAGRRYAGCPTRELDRTP